MRNSEGVKVLRTDDVKNAIGLTQPWFDELLLRIAGDTVRGGTELASNTSAPVLTRFSSVSFAWPPLQLGEVVFDSFVDFLETGRVVGRPLSARRSGPLPH